MKIKNILKKLEIIYSIVATSISLLKKKNYKIEKLSSNFLWEIAKYIGKNKSSTNILVI